MKNKAQALTAETEMEFKDILTQLVRLGLLDLGQKGQRVCRRVLRKQAKDLCSQTRCDRVLGRSDCRIE